MTNQDFNLGDSIDRESLAILVDAINHELARRQLAGESIEFANPDDPMDWLTDELWREAEKRVAGRTDGLAS